MISIIIPTFQEQNHIAETIRRLRQAAGHSHIEIIICDGGSFDNTLDEAGRAGANLVITSGKKGRAAQMNYGASMAKGDILYFLHADTIPPDGFAAEIETAVRNNCLAGCYRLSFDHEHWFLKANCWFTRFDVNSFRFGDQSLFVENRIFRQTGGFCEKHIVLEDQEIIKRIKRNTRFTIIQKPVRTSARKYLQNGIYKTQSTFFLIYLMYKMGVSQARLVSVYKKVIQQDKY